MHGPIGYILKLHSYLIFLLNPGGFVKRPLNRQRGSGHARPPWAPHWFRDSNSLLLFFYLGILLLRVTPFFFLLSLPCSGIHTRNWPPMHSETFVRNSPSPFCNTWFLSRTFSCGHENNCENLFQNLLFSGNAQTPFRRIPEFLLLSRIENGSGISSRRDRQKWLADYLNRPGLQIANINLQSRHELTHTRLLFGPRAQ